MKSSEFVPQYDETVKESLGNQFTAINGYGSCLTLPSALILASFFEPKPAIVMLPPVPQDPASPYRFNHPVPWFRFGSGVLRNAARLATYWGMPGVNGKELEFAKVDIDTPVEGWDGQ